jgi:predicted dehydrogenase
VTAAVRAGKHVLCEWPLGNGLKEAEELAALARQHGVKTFMGLQVHGAPYARYLRDLIKDGYVGDVVSTTFVGSIPNWGPSAYGPHMDYLLDRNQGASLLAILGGHSLEALTWVLGGEFSELSAILANQYPRVKRLGTGEELDKTVDDQAAVVGKLTTGAVVTFNIRGGITRGKQLKWIINGTKGDLEVTNNLYGNTQAGDFVIRGAAGEAKDLVDLPIPDKYKPAVVPETPESESYPYVGLYTDLLSDLREGTHLLPTFEDAVRRHRSVDAIERAAASGQRQSYNL